MEEAVLQVLEVLSEDLAIEVLRSSSATLQSKLVQLSPAGRSLTVVAHNPGIESACSCVSDFAGPSSELPMLSVCVDTTHTRRLGDQRERC